MDENLIDRAEKAAERLEAANKASEDIIKRNEASRILGGQSSAGGKPAEISKEDKLKQDMKAYFKGTAIENAFK